MRRILLVGASVVVLTAVLVPSAAARGRSDNTNPSSQAVGYWTAERAQGATPRDVILDVGMGPIVPNPNPNKPDNPNKPPKNEEPDDPGGEDPAPSGDVDGAPWPDPSGDPDVDHIVGRVLFTMGGRDYVCSASTIATPNNWVVLTAGHCAYDQDRGVPASNFVFVPDFEDVLSFGCTTPNTCFESTPDGIHTTTSWKNNAADKYLRDVAFVVLDAARSDYYTTTPHGGFPRVEFGDGSATGFEVEAFGYPAAKKYDGTDLIYCRGLAIAGPGSYGDNPALACDLTGGSSGGPWYKDDGAGGREAISLNSFGLRGFNGYMFGPVFEVQAQTAYDHAAA